MPVNALTPALAAMALCEGRGLRALGAAAAMVSVAQTKHAKLTAPAPLVPRTELISKLTLSLAAMVCDGEGMEGARHMVSMVSNSTLLTLNASAPLNQNVSAPLEQE